MNSKLFNSISDRQNIADAYSRVCESVEEPKDSVKHSSVSSSSNQNRVSALDFLASEYPNASAGDLNALDDAIAEYLNAEDFGEFRYLMPEVEVGFHTENDGIGRYEYWGHDEYDAGNDLPVIDDLPDPITDGTPDGTVLVFDGDESKIEADIYDRYQGNFDWDDEDGHGGTYSSYSASLWYKLMVDDRQKFIRFVERLSWEKGIPMDGAQQSSEASPSVGESASAADEDGEETFEVSYDDDGNRIPPRIRWEGRGKDVDWNYIDILKYTKSLNVIKDTVDDIIYHRLWDLQFSEGERREKAFDELRDKLELISKESHRWSPNKLLPGYAELMRDIEKVDKVKSY